MYDVVIIGSGPAGLSAAIYAKRAMLNMIVIEKAPMGGGQIINTSEVDNYPGLKGISGFDLGMKFEKHAKSLGAEFIEASVTEIVDKGDYKEVVTDQGKYETKTIIIATGGSYRNLDVPGEMEHVGMGVSYCATCDGAFFRDKNVAVVGGGDVAAQDAIFLSRICKKVYLIHRRDELRAAKSLQERIFSTENIEILWDSEIQKINGESQVESIDINNKKKEENYTLDVNGVFIAVGMVPNSEAARQVVDCDNSGWIIAGEDCKTSCEGIFAAGDIRTKELRQVITAAADGAIAISSAQTIINVK